MINDGRTFGRHCDLQGAEHQTKSYYPCEKPPVQSHICKTKSDAISFPKRTTEYSYTEASVVANGTITGSGKGRFAIVGG